MTTESADTPKIIQVGEGFCVRQEIDNMAWIDLGEYALVVDALEQPQTRQEVLAAIRQTLGSKTVRYVLNTHTHYDHVALNAAFQEAYGSEIVNAQTAPLPAQGRWFEGSRRRVQMLPLPGCHTPEDCIVWAPLEGALFTGDIFGWGVIPLTVNLRADTAQTLRDSYRRMIELGPKVVIPGHGPLCTVNELRRWVDYLDWLIEQVRREVQAGRKDEEIMQSIPPPADMHSWWRFLKWKHQDSLTKVLKSVRKGWL
jgi:cyclase